MTAVIQNRVKKLSIDKDTGEVYGFQLDGIDGYFTYSKEEFRGQPWDKHPVGSIVEVGYNTQVKDDGTSKRWVKTISRLDGETEDVPFDDYVPWEDSAELEREVQRVRDVNAQKVAGVLDAEDKRNRSISRQVAIKCAADVVVAYTTRCPDNLLSTSNIANFIDTCVERFLLGVSD